MIAGEAAGETPAGHENAYFYGCLVLLGLWALTWLVIRIKRSRGARGEF